MLGDEGGSERFSPYGHFDMGFKIRLPRLYTLPPWSNIWNISHESVLAELI